MDAHAFRCLCSSLQRLLLGARLEKIQRPTPDLHVFTVYAGGQKRFLMLRHGRTAPLLFFADHKVPAPQEPGAVVMRLRRYCAGRRVKAVRCDWLGRKIGLLMHHEPETWLVLDLKTGPSLCSDFSVDGELGTDSAINTDMLRADLDALYARGQEAILALDALEQGPQLLPEPSHWRDYPFMTPALRKTLVALAMEDPAEAAALVMDILADIESPSNNESQSMPDCNLFVYCALDGEHEVPAKLSAWPLPKQLQYHDNEHYTEHYFSDAIKATTFFGQGVAFTGISQDAQRLAAKPFSNESARLKRLLAKLDSEEKRLQKMLALRDEAVALQAVLYQVPVDAKLSHIEVPVFVEGTREASYADHADHAEQADQIAQKGDDAPRISIKLNPLRTVRENMADMFHQSRRGARGLAILAERRADIVAQEALASHQVLDITAQKTVFSGEAERASDISHHADVRLVQQAQAQKKEQKRAQKLGQKVSTKNGSFATKSQAPKTQAPKVQALSAKYAKLVESFQSCDGFRLLRGRNSEGNGAVLKLAQAHDIWMHAADGPSAHLIIKRDHAQHDVPQTTLEEAAQLVAVKSWQRDDAQAEIMCAYAKDVKAIKGAAAGKVRVERTFTSLTVRVPHDSVS